MELNPDGQSWDRLEFCSDDIKYDLNTFLKTVRFNSTKDLNFLYLIFDGNAVFYRTKWFLPCKSEQTFFRIDAVKFLDPLVFTIFNELELFSMKNMSVLLGKQNKPLARNELPLLLARGPQV